MRHRRRTARPERATRPGVKGAGDPRQKARGLIKLALNESAESAERATAAMQAVAIIDQYGLLENPIDNVFDKLKNDETFKAVKNVTETLTDPGLMMSLKQIGSQLGRLRKG